MNKCIQFISVGLILLLPSTAFPLVIQLNNLGGAEPGTQAFDGFSQAASLWESVITDPITINLDVGFSTLPSGVLGQTQSFTQTVSYADLHQALIADNSSAYDQSALAHLPLGTALDFLTNDPSGNILLDDNDSANNRFFDVNRANLKALNLLGNSPDPDASIEFSDAFSYDFSQNDGIDSNDFDFVGIALHEIGHALGFVSGVDALDYFSANGPGQGQVSNFDNFSVFSVLDLYRYSDRSLQTASGLRDLAIGDADQYLSYDGGATVLGEVSKGRYNGNGRQASHWQDNLGIGLMDPTLTRGELGLLTLDDLTAFDVIGYEINPQAIQVPIPNTFLLFALGLLFMQGYKKKTRQAKRTL